MRRAGLALFLFAAVETGFFLAHAEEGALDKWVDAWAPAIHASLRASLREDRSR